MVENEEEKRRLLAQALEARPDKGTEGLVFQQAILENRENREKAREILLKIIQDRGATMENRQIAIYMLNSQ